MDWRLSSSGQSNTAKCYFGAIMQIPPNFARRLRHFSKKSVSRGTLALRQSDINESQVLLLAIPRQPSTGLLASYRVQATCLPSLICGDYLQHRRPSTTLRYWRRRGQGVPCRSNRMTKQPASCIMFPQAGLLGPSGACVALMLGGAWFVATPSTV
jgi:hypothetical protein